MELFFALPSYDRELGINIKMKSSLWSSMLWQSAISHVILVGERHKTNRLFCFQHIRLGHGTVDLPGFAHSFFH